MSQLINEQDLKMDCTNTNHMCSANKTQGKSKEENRGIEEEEEIGQIQQPLRLKR